jgi:hypothetical protein
VALTKPSQNAPGGFFRAADYTDAVAVVIEPVSLRTDVPNTYRGVTKNRDELTANVSAFLDFDSLDAGKPTVSKNVIIDKVAIVNAAKDGAVAGVVRKLAGKENEYFALVDLDNATQVKVDAWYDGREAATQAAIDAAPGFDD